MPNLSRMMALAEAFPDRQILSALSKESGWSHFVELLPLGEYDAATLSPRRQDRQGTGYSRRLLLDCDVIPEALFPFAPFAPLRESFPLSSRLCEMGVNSSLRTTNSKTDLGPRLERDQEIQITLRTGVTPREAAEDFQTGDRVAPGDFRQARTIRPVAASTAPATLPGRSGR